LTAHIKNLRFSCFYQINVISSLSLSISLSLKFYNKVDSGFLWNHIFCCYSTIQQGAVTDLSRTISNRRLRLFYFIKLYFKSELFDLYLTAEIQNRVKLCAKSTAGNPDPISISINRCQSSIEFQQHTPGCEVWRKETPFFLNKESPAHLLLWVERSMD
jgi:hypothetical protein